MSVEPGQGGRPAGERRARTVWGVALGLGATALCLGLALAFAAVTLFWMSFLTLGAALLVPLVLAIKGGIALARSPRLPAPRWWWTALTVAAGIPLCFLGPLGGRHWWLDRQVSRLPVFPGARLIGRHVQVIEDEDDGSRSRLVFETAAPAADIPRFFDDALGARGWKLDTPESDVRYHVYWYLRPGSWVSVNVCHKLTEGWCSGDDCAEWSGVKYVEVTYHASGLEALGRTARCHAERQAGSER